MRVLICVENVEKREQLKEMFQKRGHKVFLIPTPKADGSKLDVRGRNPLGLDAVGLVGCEEAHWQEWLHRYAYGLPRLTHQCTMKVN